VKTVQDVLHHRRDPQPYNFSGAYPMGDGSTAIYVFEGINRCIGISYGKSPAHAMLRAVRLRNCLHQGGEQ
jgi:hypothetical protein